MKKRRKQNPWLPKLTMLHENTRVLVSFLYNECIDSY